MISRKHSNLGFPACISLSVKFNAHAIFYQTVADWLLEEEGPGYNSLFDWVSQEERQRSIDTDSVWVCQWYPNTPVGFVLLAASTFEALMAAVLETSSAQEQPGPITRIGRDE